VTHCVPVFEGGGSFDRVMIRSVVDTVVSELSAVVYTERLSVFVSWYDVLYASHDINK
jgi:hypothetical protein